MSTHKRPPIPVIVLVVLLVAGLGGWWWWSATRPAADAGLAAGDEWLGVELPAEKPGTPVAWRLTRLDELPLYAGSARRVTALVARDKRLLRLPLALPEKSTTWRLAPTDSSTEAPTWPGR